MKSIRLISHIMFLFALLFTHILTAHEPWRKITIFFKWLKNILFEPLLQINFIELYNL